MANYVDTYINGYTLKVSYEEKIIRIKNDLELKKCLLDMGPMALATTLKYNYAKGHCGSYNVSTKSLAYEIVGHVVPGLLAKAIIPVLPLMGGGVGLLVASWLDKKIVTPTEVIDSGNEGHDENRFIWDELANFDLPILKHI